VTEEAQIDLARADSLSGPDAARDRVRRVSVDADVETQFQDYPVAAGLCRPRAGRAGLPRATGRSGKITGEVSA